MTSFKCFLLFVVLLNAGAVLSTRQREQGRLFEDLNPRRPRVEFESDGGRLETWGGRGSGVFEDANVAACRVTLKPRGLWMPSYVDAPSLHVVTRGSGRVGIVSPFSDHRTQENTFKVIKGDVVAIREGHVVWWYNDEDDRDVEIVGVADVTQSSEPASVRAFHLAGAREDQREEDEQQEQAGYGGIIHGFSKEVLARSWELDEESVRELLESQPESGIIRLDEHITFTDSPQEQLNFFVENFIYRLGKVHPDLRVENGGEVREVSSHKFPILKSLGLGLDCMHLEQGAMVPPSWFHGAHQVLYVVSGRGRVEVVRHNGERALDTDVEEGSLVLIPAFFPNAKVASRDESFHYISFLTSHDPRVSFAAGRKSVYRGIPLRVLSRMLNVGEEEARQVQRAHHREAVIFAPASRASL